MSTYNQASLQLSILESLLRLVCTKLNQRLWGPDTECATVRQFYSPQTEEKCTEHKPGSLHAATQWTHPATAPPPNSHECEDQCEWNVFV